MSEWTIGAVAVKGMTRGVIVDYPTPGWVRGVWGIDFRTAWEGDNSTPVYCLTHMPSGVCVAAFEGCLAEVQAFVDALDGEGDWSAAISGVVRRCNGRAISSSIEPFERAFFDALIAFHIRRVSTAHAIAPFTADAMFTGSIQ